MRKVLSPLIGVSLLLLAAAGFVSCNKSLTEASQKYPNLIVTGQDLRTTSTAVTLSQAKGIALVFLQSKHKNKTITIESGETIIKNGIPYLHVFNAGKDDGFVIIASDSIYRPILAFDSAKNFDLGNINPGLVIWMNKHAHELDYVRHTKSALIDSIAAENKKIWKNLNKAFGDIAKSNTDPAIHRAATSSGGGHTDGMYYPPEVIGSGADVYTTSTGVLLATEWSQRNPWNQYCQVGHGNGYAGHSPVGCVPLAMGQIMYFHAYTWPATYNFSSMVPKVIPTVYATTPVGNPGGFTESATLVHDIGTSRYTDAYQFTHQFADYTDDETSADMSNIHEIFGQFGYTSSMTTPYYIQTHSSMTQGLDYASFLIAEVSNNRPCILGGKDSYGSNGLGYWALNNGHAWVVDGVSQVWQHTYDMIQYYDIWGNPSTTDIQYTGPPYAVASYLHMNWGWGSGLYGGPNNDGWFDCSVDYTSSPTSANATTNFQYFQEIIYNIHP